MKTKPSYVYQILAFLAVIVGPIWLLTRGNATTSLEKFIYIMSLFPLGIIAMGVHFRGKRQVAMQELDSERQKSELTKIRKEWHRVVAFGSLLMIIAGLILAWLI